MKLKNTLVCALFFANFTFGQLTDGSIAPDFTLTDINGTTQNLYSYLDQGKTVYIDFFATHCPFCWSYHNTHSLSNLYDQYGPGTSTDEVMVFAIDLDQNNGTNEFYGISGVTQGNWVAGTNYPQLNPEGAELTSIVNSYQAVFYPLIYAICPDRTITQIGKQTTSVLYQHVASCSGPLGVDESNNATGYQVQFGSDRLLKISCDCEHVQGVFDLIDLQGKIILTGTVSEPVSLSDLRSGFYFLNIRSGNELYQQKLLVE